MFSNETFNFELSEKILLLFFSIVSSLLKFGNVKFSFSSSLSIVIN